MHLSYNLSLVTAIFYVNDTLTPHQHPHNSASSTARESTSGSGERRATIEPLVRAALSAATAAHSLARYAQRMLESELGVSLPVVQYAYTDECRMPGGSLGRQQSSDPTGAVLEQRRRTARAVFKAAPRPGGVAPNRCIGCRESHRKA